MPDRPQTPEERAAQEKARVHQLPTLARQPLNWGALEQRGEPPPRLWACDYWLGMGHVTVLFGRGGIGKSILAQQWASALALGIPFIENVSQARRVLYWASEDDHDELWRRQMGIAKQQNQALSAYSNLSLIPLADENCTLFDVAPLSGMVMRTSVLEELRQQIGDLGADVIVLDNIGRLFGANENSRHDVTSFIAALNYAAAPTKAAVLLLGHVARSQGSEFAGSAAWENASRARLWLTDQKPDAPIGNDEEEEQDNEFRYFAKRKVNYSSRDVCKLRWVDGCYHIEGAPTPAVSGGLIASISHERARNVVMAAIPKLQAMGQKQLTTNASSPNFLPRLISAYRLQEGFTKTDLARAMRELMTEGALKIVPLGKNAYRQPISGLAVCEPSTTTPTPPTPPPQE